jgi:hypothetical protein
MVDAIAGTILALATISGVVAVVFLARIARVRVRAYWTRDVTSREPLRPLPPALTLGSDLRWFTVTAAVFLIGLALAMTLLAIT